MKTSHQLLLAVLLVLAPALLVLVGVSEDFNNELRRQRDKGEYGNTKDMMQQIFNLQSNKLALVQDVIHNDALFIHSLFLYEELGYVERVEDLLSQYTTKG